MTINVDDKSVTSIFEGMDVRVRDAIMKKIDDIGLVLVDKIKGNLSGQKRNVVSGKLRDSVGYEVYPRADAVVLHLFTSGVPYAAIQDAGGTTRAHDIYPKKASALAFVIGDKLIFAQHVKHPGSVIPPGLFFADTVANSKDDIVRDVLSSITEINW